MTDDLTIEITRKTEHETDEHDTRTIFTGTINEQDWTAERISGDGYISIEITEDLTTEQNEAIFDALWHPTSN